MLDQEKRRGDVYSKGLLPFFQGDFGERLYHSNTGVVNQQIYGRVPDFRDETLNAFNLCQIVNQFYHPRAAFLDSPAGIGKRYGVATMQQ